MICSTTNSFCDGKKEEEVNYSKYCAQLYITVIYIKPVRLLIRFNQQA